MAVTRQIIGANGTVLTIAVLPNAAGTSGDAQLVGLTDASGNALTPAQDSTFTGGTAQVKLVSPATQLFPSVGGSSYAHANALAAVPTGATIFTFAQAVRTVVVSNLSTNTYIYLHPANANATLGDLPIGNQGGTEFLSFATQFVSLYLPTASATVNGTVNGIVLYGWA